MDSSTASWLVSDAATAALAAAAAQDDPGSLAAATRLRALCPPEQAAAVLEQAALRRRAATKFGTQAADWFLTGRGLEQATRPGVARRRARRFADLGVSRVVDLGCGLGADARALLDAGLDVTAVELDPVTAILAGANLGRRVLVGDAVDLAPDLLAPDLLASDPQEPGVGVFCDPARRTASGRTWRVEDFTPPWEFVTSLLAGDRVACIKLGPGLPHALIPDAVEAEWVSDAGTVVEAALWAGPGLVPGRRRAVVDGHGLARDASAAPPPVAPLGSYLYEPDGAIIRAGLVPAVADELGAWRLHDGVAYLTGSTLVRTPWAQPFEVLDVLPYKEKALRAWVRDARVGVLEIKKRGVDADPAALRRRLRPQGPNAATLVLTPTASGAIAVVARRVPAP